MSFKRQVAYNTTVQIIGKAIVTVLSVLITILLTRYLGPSKYGQYNIVITFVGFFVVLADLGVYPIAVREMSQHPENKEKIYGNVVTYRVFSAILTMGLAFLIGLLMPYPEVVKFAIGIYAVATFVGLLVNLVMAVFQINYRMDLPAIADVLGRGLYLLVLFFALQRHYSLYGIFWLLVLTSIFNLGLNLFLGRRYIKLKPALDFVFIKSFLRESLPLGLATIFGMIHFKIDTILLSLMKPSFDVGIYGASYRIFENLIIIPAIFVGMVFPRLSFLFMNDFAGFKKIFQKSLDLLILIAIPVVIIFYFLSPYLVSVVAGREFYLAIFPLKILLFSLFATFLISIFSYTLIAAKKQTVLIYVWAALSAINIILNLIFIPHFSYKGAAVVTVTTETLTLITLYVLVKKLINIKPNLAYVTKSFLPALIFISGFYFLAKSHFINLDYFADLALYNQILLVSAVLIFSFLIYGLLLLLFKVIRKNEIYEIIKINKEQP